MVEIKLNYLLLNKKVEIFELLFVFIRKMKFKVNGNQVKK